MQDRPQETFAVIIEEKKDTTRGIQVAMKIPAFGSDYPILISDIPPDVIATMKVGDAMNVVLERQNLKKPKTGAYDGSKLYHWWWGFVRTASPAEGAKAQETAKVAVASEDRKEVNIRRAVALKAAVDFIGYAESGSVELVLQFADTFDTWLAAGIAQCTSPVPQTEAPGPVSVDDFETRLNKLYSWAKRKYDLAPDEVLKIAGLKIDQVTESTDLRWVAEQVVKAKRA